MECCSGVERVLPRGSAYDQPTGIRTGWREEDQGSPNGNLSALSCGGAESPASAPIRTGWGEVPDINKPEAVLIGMLLRSATGLRVPRASAVDVYFMRVVIVPPPADLIVPSTIGNLRFRQTAEAGAVADKSLARGCNTTADAMGARGVLAGEGGRCCFIT